MDRYQFTPKKSGKWETSRLCKPPVHVDDQYIFSREGDRLDLLAKQFYDDVTKWWIIAIANDLRIGSFVIPEGLQIRIPTYTGDVNDGLRLLNQDK